MSRKPHIHLSDFAGLTRLGTDIAAELTDVSEALQHNITHSPGIRGTPLQERTSAIAGLVYESIRGVTRLAGGTTDGLSPLLVPNSGERSWPEREAVLAALNGIMGDHLAATGNPLAISMQLRKNGQRLRVESKALRTALTPPGHKLLVLVHGLCMNDLQWKQKGSGFGAALARDSGFTPVYLHYNSGLHTSTNGRAFADLIEDLLQQWPAPLKEFVILAHSMGGLVARSAYHYGVEAGQTWPERLTKLIFLGTPHHGALLERGGNWLTACLGLSPYTAPFARLGKLRSAGIIDLRYGNLLDEDWQGLDPFEHSGDLRHPVPLPQNVLCYAIAANVGGKKVDAFGDGMVSVDSALGRHEDPERTLHFAPWQQSVGYGMNHLDLISRPFIYKQVRRWIDPLRKPSTKARHCA